MNDSIIQGTGAVPGGQFTTNTTSTTDCNEPWRYNNGSNTATDMNQQTHTTRPPNRNGFQNNLPNSSDNRNGLTCFKCGEQGHIKRDCKERVYCTNCRMTGHDTKVCRKHHHSTPSPTNSHIPMGYHPKATPPPLMGTTGAAGQQTQQTGVANYGPLFQNLFDKVFLSLYLKSGYYHIGLSDLAKPKSAFILSSLRKYQFNRVPF